MCSSELRRLSAYIAAEHLDVVAQRVEIVAQGENVMFGSERVFRARDLQLDGTDDRACLRGRHVRFFEHFERLSLHRHR